MYGVGAVPSGDAALKQESASVLSSKIAGEMGPGSAVKLGMSPPATTLSYGRCPRQCRLKADHLNHQRPTIFSFCRTKIQHHRTLFWTILCWTESNIDEINGRTRRTPKFQPIPKLCRLSAWALEDFIWSVLISVVWMGASILHVNTRPPADGEIWGKIGDISQTMVNDVILGYI